MAVRVYEDHCFSHRGVNNRAIVGLQVWGTNGPAAEEQPERPQQTVSRFAPPGSWMLSRTQRSHPSKDAGNRTRYSCLKAAFCNYIDFFTEQSNV